MSLLYNSTPDESEIIERLVKAILIKRDVCGGVLTSTDENFEYKIDYTLARSDSYFLDFNLKSDLDEINHCIIHISNCCFSRVDVSFNSKRILLTSEVII